MKCKISVMEEEISAKCGFRSCEVAFLSNIYKIVVAIA